MRAGYRNLGPQRRVDLVRRLRRPSARARSSAPSPSPLEHALYPSNSATNFWSIARMRWLLLTSGLAVSVGTFEERGKCARSRQNNSAGVNAVTVASADAHQKAPFRRTIRPPRAPPIESTCRRLRRPCGASVFDLAFRTSKRLSAASPSTKAPARRKRIRRAPALPRRAVARHSGPQVSSFLAVWPIAWEPNYVFFFAIENGRREVLFPSVGI